jgi:cytochrome b involved in lipid metabolism
MDTAAMVPFQSIVYDMVPDNPGRWLLHCHVQLHLAMGMSTTFVVVPRDVNQYDPAIRTGVMTSQLQESIQLGSSFSVAWVVIVESDQVEITISASGDQWIGFGVGTSMAGGDMIICSTQSGSPACLDYYAPAHTNPVLDSSSGGSNDVILLSYSFTNGITKYTYRRPLSASDSYDRAISTSSSSLTPIIFAVGQSPTLAYHRERGTATLNFVAGVKSAISSGVSVDTSTKYNDSHFYAVHAIGMCFAWLVLVPAAFFLARFFKDKAWWISFHRAMNSLAALITLILGIGMIVQRSTMQVLTYHGYLGLFILGFIVVQILLGFFTIFLKYQPVTLKGGVEGAAAFNISKQLGGKVKNFSQTQRSPPSQRAALNLKKVSDLQPTPANYSAGTLTAETSQSSANKELTLQSGRWPTKKASPGQKERYEKLALMRKVWLLGMNQLSSAAHRLIGKVLIVAGIFNIFLGLNLLFPSNITMAMQLDAYNGLLGTWACLLFLVLLLLQETRRWRIFSCCYRERGYRKVPIAFADHQSGGLDATTDSIGAIKDGWIANNPNAPGQTGALTMTRSEFEALVTEGRHLIIMNGGVFDIEEFEELHPGGVLVLKSIIGMDITTYFLHGSITATGHQHVHTQVAQSIIMDYHIANIIPDFDKLLAVEVAPAASHLELASIEERKNNS